MFPKNSGFTTNAVFVFSDLRTWGWIIFGLGVTVASLSALGQLLFAQAFPVWSLMIMAIDFLVICGLVAYGGRRQEMAASRSYHSYESRGSGTITDMNDRERTTRAA